MTIIQILFATTLLLLSSICSYIYSGLIKQNHYRLKYQAQSGLKSAKIVYSIQALGSKVLLALLFVKILFNTTLIILISSKFNDIVAVLVASILIITFNEVVAVTLMAKQYNLVISKLAPILRQITTFLAPLVRPLSKLFRTDDLTASTSVFNKQEILDILENTKVQQGNNLSSEELKILKSALSFGDKKIRDVMTPKRMAMIVSKEMEVGPILMDELHHSGYSRFPVTSQSKNSIFVGTLYLHDLVGETSAKKVKDLMKSQVFYAHEEESLDHALKAFLKTHHHLFVVVNSFEEFVGVLSIEDVLEEIIGHEIIDEFDQHDNLRAVASSLAEKEKTSREKDVEENKK
ncbi:MAG: CNNM domain-containing protein [Candidatus Saccharibacteria bacterium]|nr:CNNM domain-containing protein [Candidatus Saccharibacteria bacterium]